jgi:hypothetical protein
VLQNTINPRDKLRLTASIVYGSNGRFSWQCDDSSIALSSVSLTATTMLLPPQSTTSQSTFTTTLILSGNSLPERSKFTFSLTCVLDNGLTSSAAITVVTNGPPLPGYFTVSPALGGEEIKTLFTFSAASWTDENLPLTYSFGFVSGTGTPLIVQSTSALSYGTSTLPAGNEGSAYQVLCTAQIYDEMMANSSAVYLVEVKKSSMKFEDLQGVLNMQISEGSGGADSTKQAIATVSSMLNNVNCTNTINCRALNR